MATAEKTEITTIEVVETTVPAATLTLTEEEAFVLVNILAKVGGTGDRRSLVDGICAAMRSAGYTWSWDGQGGIVGTVIIDELMSKD